MVIELAIEIGTESEIETALPSTIHFSVAIKAGAGPGRRQNAGTPSGKTI